MTFIALYHDPENLLATDQLVLTANEVSSMDKSVEMSFKISQHLKEKEEQLTIEKKLAYDKAYAEGREAGLKIGREITAEELTSMVDVAHKQRLDLQKSVARLAIQVVRKIAGNIGAPKMVSGIALTAAEDLVADNSIKLTIHPTVKKMVSTMLKSSNVIKSKKNLHIDIRTDEALDPYDCLLDTDYGQIVANLDDQLKRLEAVLSEGLALEVNTE